MNVETGGNKTRRPGLFNNEPRIPWRRRQRSRFLLTKAFTGRSTATRRARTAAMRRDEDGEEEWRAEINERLMKERWGLLLGDAGMANSCADRNKDADEGRSLSSLFLPESSSFCICRLFFQRFPLHVSPSHIREASAGRLLVAGWSNDQMCVKTRGRTRIENLPIRLRSTTSGDASNTCVVESHRSEHGPASLSCESSSRCLHWEQRPPEAVGDKQSDLLSSEQHVHFAFCFLYFIPVKTGNILEASRELGEIYMTHGLHTGAAHLQSRSRWASKLNLTTTTARDGVFVSLSGHFLWRENNRFPLRNEMKSTSWSLIRISWSSGER